jgi:hypothetical protein
LEAGLKKDLLFPLCWLKFSRFLSNLRGPFGAAFWRKSPENQSAAHKIYSFWTFFRKRRKVPAVMSLSGGPRV